MKYRRSHIDYFTFINYISYSRKFITFRKFLSKNNSSIFFLHYIYPTENLLTKLSPISYFRSCGTRSCRQTHARDTEFYQSKAIYSPVCPGIVPSHILAGINCEAKLMCQSAASHHAFAPLYQCPARFAHNSLMWRRLFFRLFNSGERPRPPDPSAICTDSSVSRPSWKGSRSKNSV